MGSWPLVPCYPVSVSGILFLGSFLILPLLPSVISRGWSYRLLPRFPSQPNFVQIQQIGGLAGDWRLQVTSLAAMGCSVVPVSPQWVLHGLWSLHPKKTTAILCLSILEWVFIPPLLISGLSRHSLFNSWLRQQAYNQFRPLNSFRNKYLSGFCFSVSGSPDGLDQWEP